MRVEAIPQPSSTYGRCPPVAAVLKIKPFYFMPKKFVEIKKRINFVTEKCDT
jgi:hypothetical protein